jgi:Glycosyl transferase 4-like domain
MGPAPTFDGAHVTMKRLVYICDWLPPDFGAVGQYAMLFARESARSGLQVTLVGLTTGEPRREAPEPVGEGALEVIRVRRPTYTKQRLAERLLWTIVSNLLLVKAAFGSMRQADAVLFTGSPPLMLHFIAPLNLMIRTQLIYRITDFHPECLIADRGHAGFLLNVLLRLTQFWRNRVDRFEVLGLDQARRLAETGIPEERICLKRNPSPVVFWPGLRPLPLPDALRDGSGVILYSGNWGVAHEEDTFIEGYSEYLRQSRYGLKLWLNAVGAKSDRVENELRRRGIFVYRTRPVPLEQLPALLVAADVHLITLRDDFVGYVLPSKVHACIDSGKRILFVGSKTSDVHLLANDALPSYKYCRVEVGDVDGLVHALLAMEHAISRERDLGVVCRETTGSDPSATTRAFRDGSSATATIRGGSGTGAKAF